MKPEQFEEFMREMIKLSEESSPHEESAAQLANGDFSVVDSTKATDDQELDLRKAIFDRGHPPDQNQ